MVRAGKPARGEPEAVEAGGGKSGRRWGIEESWVRGSRLPPSRPALCFPSSTRGEFPACWEEGERHVLGEGLS